MNEFHESANRADLLKRIHALEQSGIMREAKTLDDSVRETRPVAATLYWEVNSSLASIAAYRLGDFDREARRATEWILKDSPNLPRPLPIGRAGFDTIDSATGSFDVLLGPIGLTAAVILSNPVQFLLTVQALAVDAKWIVRAWSSHDLPSLPRPTVPDIRRILEALKNVPPHKTMASPGVPSSQGSFPRRFEDEDTRVSTPYGGISIPPDINATIHISGDGTTVIELRGRHR